jgi:hypothetical protein
MLHTFTARTALFITSGTCHAAAAAASAGKQGHLACNRWGHMLELPQQHDLPPSWQVCVMLCDSNSLGTVPFMCSQLQQHSHACSVDTAAHAACAWYAAGVMSLFLKTYMQLLGRCLRLPLDACGSRQPPQLAGLPSAMQLPACTRYNRNFLKIDSASRQWSVASVLPRGTDQALKGCPADQPRWLQSWYCKLLLPIHCATQQHNSHGG